MSSSKKLTSAAPESYYCPAIPRLISPLLTFLQFVQRRKSFFRKISVWWWINLLSEIHVLCPIFDWNLLDGSQMLRNQWAITMNRGTCCKLSSSLTVQNISKESDWLDILVFHNSCLIIWIQQNKIYKKIRDSAKDWTLIACLAVSHSKHYTMMCFVFVWDCSWVILMYGWFCSIHLIRWISLHFEKKQ